MSEEIWRNIGALQASQQHLGARQDAQEDRYQRLESKIDAVAAKMESKLEAFETKLKSDMALTVASSAMNAAELVLSRFKEAYPPTQGSFSNIGASLVANASKPWVVGPVMSGCTLAIVVVLKKMGIDIG